MVDLCNVTGSKTDLVAVAGVARSGSGGYLSGRELTLDGLFDRQQRVGSAGDSHCLVYIGTSGKRVADSAAETCRSAAERLDFGRVVVGLVLEHEEPVLVPAVNVYLDADGACVDLLAFVEILQNAVFLELFRGEGSDVHEAQRLVVAAQLVAVRLVFSVCICDVGGLDIRVVDDGAECCVAAVIRPVGVDHADLSDGRIAVLALEVILTELDIVVVHCKAVVYDEISKLGVGLVYESGEGLNAGRNGVLYFQGIVLVETALAGLDCVDEVVLDTREVFIGYLSLEHVDLSVLNNRALAGAEHLNALSRGIRTLIELTGQELNSEHALVSGGLRELVIYLVYRRLGEHGGNCGFKVLFRELFTVVAVDDPYIFDGLYAQRDIEVGKHGTAVYRELRLLFNVNTVYHCFSSIYSQRIAAIIISLYY